MFLKQNHYCLLFLILGNFLFGQNKILGKVIDISGNPVAFANVVLKQKNSNIIEKFTQSDDEGKYEINSIKSGDYVICFAALSYKEETFFVSFDGKNNVIKNITLNIDTNVIDEVIVTNKQQDVLVKKDTIVFDVASFKNGSEQVIEDLLKKIPGITVSDEGIVKVGGQEVEKVMIEGDDFFEKGYKILTKNMPVSPVEKVELYQHYSNNKHLKGVENSEKVALNLKLKDGVKNQWFGNAELGYGLFSKNRYELRTNVMNFSKKNKYYFLSNINNTGIDAVGDINHLIRPANSVEPGNVGNNQSANTILSLNAEQPQLKKERVNINNNEMVSLNSIFTLTSKTKLKALSFFNSDEMYYYKNDSQSYNTFNNSFVNSEISQTKKGKTTGFGKIDLTYDISKNITIDIVSKYNITSGKDNSKMVFNGISFDEKMNANNQLFDQKIIYTNKLRESKVLVFSARYINEKTPQVYSFNNFLFQDLFSQPSNNTIQSAENAMQFMAIETHLFKKYKNESLLELQFGNQLRIDELNSNLKLKYNDVSSDEPVGYQNEINYLVNDLYLKSKCGIKKNSLGLITQLDFHQLHNKFDDAISNQSKYQSPFYINPKVIFSYKINDKNKIFSSYSFNKTNATILNVFNNYINTGFRNFEKGAGDFNQLNASTFSLNYIMGDWNDKFSITTMTLYSKNKDFFSTKSILNQNYVKSEKALFENNEFYSITSNADYYFDEISTIFKVNLDAIKSTSKNIVNNSEIRNIQNLGLNYELEIRSAFKGFFNFDLGSKWMYNKVTVNSSNSNTNNTIFLDLLFAINEKMNFHIQSERYLFGNLDKQNNKYWFLDFQSRYTALKNKLTFFLSGNNLLNTDVFRNYNISDISISKTEFKLQPRYMMLKIEYRF